MLVFFVLFFAWLPWFNAITKEKSAGCLCHDYNIISISSITVLCITFGRGSVCVVMRFESVLYEVFGFTVICHNFGFSAGNLCETVKLVPLESVDGLTDIKLRKCVITDHEICFTMHRYAFVKKNSGDNSANSG